jgi:hypothetical protein
MSADNQSLIGKRVERCVYVLGERVAMGHGIVTRHVSGEVVEVDIMSLHGGAPWLVLEQVSHLQVVSP